MGKPECAGFHLTHSGGIIQRQQHLQMGQEQKKCLFIKVRNPKPTNTQGLDEILRAPYSSPCPLHEGSWKTAARWTGYAVILVWGVKALDGPH